LWDIFEYKESVISGEKFEIFEVTQDSLCKEIWARTQKDHRSFWIFGKCEDGSEKPITQFSQILSTFKFIR
jgi:hypothetical protein